MYSVSGRGPGRRQRDHLAGADRVRLALMAAAGGAAVGLGGALDPFDGQVDAGQLGQQGGLWRTAPLPRHGTIILAQAG